ncbi:carbamoylphosphate synthase large subunit short form [Bacillus manliponensis]|uniref:Carbamoylphosphate synthase large subunit short form n=1 Tax=Bacillus manliponensis TaxID=574376 RepID=A0A073K005_9BACI|nr:ATP-grasp domain-containing protein [Bacillus manliponensis]KEK20649.1 carbamoylphosphate synthase large subunit short form [Bacillus manliponensis]
MKFNVLVFPCGSQTAIDINFALRHAVRINLYGASSVDDHGSYIYKNYIGNIPNISEENFFKQFNEVLKNNKIDFIIPTHDTVALHLKEHEMQLSATVIAADVDTVKTCRYKSLTYKKFMDHSFTPTIYDSPCSITKYPVFLKPDDGQGGKGTYIANNIKEVEFHINQSPKLLICEYLPGEEVSVDCFTDRHGLLRYISPRTRKRILAGISVSSTLIELTEDIQSIADTLNHHLSFRGYWFFQLKRDKLGNWKLLEISSRMAGTSSLTIGKDVNLALLSILDFANFDITIQPNEYSLEIDRAFINRYNIRIQYERVYIDLDDTLIINDRVNTQLLQFLYQCVNDKKELLLITKHEYDVQETLQKHKISPFLFQEIIHISINDKKYKYMKTDLPAIFIDNAFAERQEVRQQLNMHAFDVNNIECLIDWRG